MKNDTRTAIVAALSDICRANDALHRSLDKVDRYAIRNGLHSALNYLSDACQEIDRYVVGDREMGSHLREARQALDKAIVDLTQHSRWFETLGDEEERR